MAKVAIIMGSGSDLGVVKGAYDALVKFGVEVDMRIMSAHRSPEICGEFATNAKANGIKVIIAAAGKAAHLAGVIAGHTTLPVIGLPIKSSTMDGLDSLLSTVQMPSGIPVATVAINGAENAGILAVQILALQDEALAENLVAHKKSMADKIEKDNSALIAELK
ncbi:MAG: 5-(carboxyamino)imidazole ribonucleotide mutase [Bacillota bacterium]